MNKAKQGFTVFGIVALSLWAVSMGCSAGAASGSSVAEEDELETAVFSVEGMSCSGCEVGLRMAVAKLEGVHEVEASYANSNTRVTYDPARVEPEQIQAAIEELGYKARLEADS